MSPGAESSKGRLPGLALVVLCSAMGLLAPGLVSLWQSLRSAEARAREETRRAARTTVQGIRACLRMPEVLNLLPAEPRFRIEGGRLEVPELLLGLGRGEGREPRILTRHLMDRTLRLEADPQGRGEAFRLLEEAMTREDLSPEDRRHLLLLGAWFAHRQDSPGRRDAWLGEWRTSFEGGKDLPPGLASGLLLLAAPGVGLGLHLARRILENPRRRSRDSLISGILRGRPVLLPEVARELAHRMLEQEDPYLRRMALGLQAKDLDPELEARATQLLDDEDPSVVAAALRSLERFGEGGTFEKIRKCLGHQDPQVRYTAITVLGRLDPGRPLPLVLPMTEDASGSIRRAIVEVCQTSLDPRAVSTLLLALRDSNPSLRKEAREALEQIRFFHEQQGFWDSFFARSKLGVRNAAEALMKQATEGRTPRIRLAAIRSLGTPADPKSLPFLIQLMESGDEPVREAAGEAVDRINEREIGKEK